MCPMLPEPSIIAFDKFLMSFSIKTLCGVVVRVCFQKPRGGFVSLVSYDVWSGESQS